jgi:hypothetical protein
MTEIFTQTPQSTTISDVAAQASMGKSGTWEGVPVPIARFALRDNGFSGRRPQN